MNHTPNQPIAPIFIISPIDAYEAALPEKRYISDSLESEGFIHASPADKLTAVANRYFVGRHDLCLLCIDPNRVTSEIRWEALRGPDAYPHIYGPLNLEAVFQVHPLTPEADGTFRIDPGQVLE